MKEKHFFYVPSPEHGMLPLEETLHALRVLRFSEGDELNLMDGQGTFYRAVLTLVDKHSCRYKIIDRQPQPPEWIGMIHLAVAPTKNMDRMEWLAEKATEIGMNCMSLLECRYSERRVVKTDRLDKILVSATKQSHKAWKPQLEGLMSFQQFIARANLPEQRFIAHCYSESDVTMNTAFEETKPFLLDVLTPRTSSLVLIGPEGDFSLDEVRAAEDAGFRSVSLGSSRLRTETAALVAVHLMRLSNR